MSGYSELIKNFSKTRDYVRDFFIYGFKIRSEFGRKSSRTYDDEKRRVESWLGDNLRYDDSVRGRQISISVDSGHISENPLYQAYYSKSFTNNDIRLHFFLMDMLSDGEFLSLKELIDRMDSTYHQLFDEQTVRNKLKECVREGIFLTEKKGKTAYFRISPDSVDSFIGEYKGLDDALKFFSETQEFGIIGNSILKDAGLKNDLFLMKHNYIVHTLEDEILTDIVDAIESGLLINIHSFSIKSTKDSETEYIAVPMQILSSLQTGRRYLAAYIPQYRRFNSFRLDFIKSVKPLKICENYDEIYEKYNRNIRKCFGVSFGTRRDTGTVAPIKITFTIDEKSEGFVIDRLKREKRIGVLNKLNEGFYQLTVDTFDPYEVMHWAKTFIGRIVSIEGGSKYVRDLFFLDIKRMNDIYRGD